MSLIKDVLALVQESSGVVDLGHLSRESGIQTSALLGILDLCVRKGYLEIEAAQPAIPCKSCAEAHTCALACDKSSRKPLVFRLKTVP